MLCIAAFIVFIAVFPVGMFFPSYRRLLGKSWHCVSRRIQLKPCDISFGEEVKQFIVGMFAFRAPWLAKFFLKTAEFWAWVFILVSIWSLWSVAHSGLNLLVYDTCDPFEVEGCSLAGDSCGIGQTRAPIWQWRAYIQDQRDYYVETFTRLPDVFRSWNPQEFTVESSTYTGNLESEQIVMEILDPSCVFCRDVWRNLKDSNAFDEARVTYLLYPIPFQEFEGYRFPNSYRLATVIESLKTLDLDWEFLDALFTQGYQEELATTNPDRAEELIELILTEELGLDSEEVKDVLDLAESDSVAESIALQRRAVEEEVRTLKIPTVFVGDARFDRVIDAETINQNLK